VINVFIIIFNKEILEGSMGKISAAHAYVNNEVALIAWALDGMIDGCLGFDIMRVRLDGLEPPKGLPAWVPFPGQENPDWKPQDTGVWPIQKLYWRDLTLRQHRSDLGRRDIGFSVKYSIRPVGDLKTGMEAVPVRQAKAYAGDARPLGYLGPAVETNEIHIELTFDGIRATFTNGILAAQWLKHAIESSGKTFNKTTVTAEIKNQKSDIRAYLTGDVLETVSVFLTDPSYKDGDVRLALYELEDEQLVDLLISNKNRIEVILSNSSKGASGWDVTDHAARTKLHRAGVKIHDRMFNNNHIGHNKFAVWRKGGKPAATMAGSTNWTSTGLCAQSNNAFVVTDEKIASAYDAYWERLLQDKFPAPASPQHAGTAAQRQGPTIRNANKTPAKAKLAGGPQAQVWFSPNTTETRKGATAPPDLAFLFDLMAKAKEAIFFLAFLPSRDGVDSVISAAIDAQKKKPNLLVAGAVSDPSAMPGFKAGNKGEGIASVEPFTYDHGGLHIVRAAHIEDMVGAFEKELAGLGHAIVHDKIVVVDPLSDNCIVAAGSHNLGFKASYENDENLMIVTGGKALAQAYAVHVLDVYDHYRFRAWQAEAAAHGKPTFQGHIQGDDKWLGQLTKGPRRDLSTYFAKA
jgi:phosphatidylserine/phosphatidylglycerophosphate/cardiolipin synthase-like enzyme